VPGGGGLAPPGTISIPGLSAPVNVDALTQLGVIVVQGNDQDVKAILQLIDDLERIGRESEVTVVMVPLEKGDATEIVYILNQPFSRVNITPSGTNELLPRTTGGAATGAP